MKVFFLYIALASSICGIAQTKHKVVKKQKANRTFASAKQNKSNTGASTYATKQLTSTSASNAFVNTIPLRISDPVILTLDAKSKGMDIDVGKSGIMGMPKRAFGFANGHILLRPNSSTSTGTINGSGSVGTGSYPGSVGTGSMAPGVNGKNAYAGVDSWGTHLTGSGIRIKEQQSGGGKRQ